MSKKGTIEFRTILAWLMGEVMFGRAHLAITRGLRRKDRRTVIAAAPRFFDMTVGAHADAVMLAAARIFDRTSAASIHTLLSTALKQKETFKHGTATEVESAIADARVSVTSLGPIVAAIRTRRNQTIAHLDARPFADPDKYIKEGLMSFSEVERVFEETGVILNRFSLLYRGERVVLDLEDAKDYEQALDLIASAMRARG